MANNTLNARLKLKMDSYDNWMAKDPVLLSGEVAFTTVSVAQEGTINTVPSVVAKVGNGVNKFSELDWLYARASDVAAWAKSATKPTYDADEITGIDAYIADYVNDQMGISVDTDTQYKLVKVNDYNYKLQSKGKSDSAWADVADSVITIPNDTDDINSLKTLVGDTDVATQIANAIAALKLSETYAPITHSHVIADVTGLQDALDAKATATDVTDLSSKVTTLIGPDADKSVRTIANEELAAQLIPETAKESLDTLQEIATWIQAHPDDASAMNDKITALQSKVGDTAVATQISTAIDSLKNGQLTTMQGEIDAVEERATTLEVKSHEHTNKTVLDGITSEKIAAWDTVSNKIDASNVSVVGKSGNVADLIQTDGDYIIFDCGTSSINI